MRWRWIVWAALLALLACNAPRGVHDARGVVEEVKPELGQVLIAHEDIPGLMPAMTMNFDVADPALLERLAPGQVIRFRIVFDGKSYRVTEAEVIGSADVGDGPRIAELAGAGPEPAPDFALVDQTERRLALADLRGKAVLLDFVYTQCPGPCPILTGIHVQARAALPHALRGRVHFVSITLDPQRDTPEALAEYARARGASGADWSFLTGKPGDVADVLRAYGVAASPGKDGEIDHIVATFLIDPQGRIARRYVGLDHEAEQIVRDLRALLEAPAGA